MKKVFVLVAVCLLAGNIFSNDAFRVQAMYIYNFTRYVNWPAEYEATSFVIGILGECEVVEELRAFTRGKKVGNKPITVVCFNNVSDITQCHILYVPHHKSEDINKIQSKVSKSNSLIICETPGSINAGAAISFIYTENKLKFELNSENANKYGLTVSSTLCNMAMSCN
jgi:hypothetical protein